MDTLDIALHWLSLGINCLPCQPGTKYLTKGVQLADYDTLRELPQVVGSFFNKNVNVAVYPSYSPATSKYLVILDFDSLPDYLHWRDQAKLQTLETSTRRGYHCYFWTEESPSGLQSDIAEVKYRKPTMIPPSRINGHQYTDNGQEIVEIEKLEDVIAATRQWPSKKESPAINIHVTGNQNNVTVNVSNDTSSFTRQSTRSVEAIKASYPITSIFPDYQETGNGKAIARCPAPAHEHGDRHPSLSLDLQSNRFNCFKPSCSLHLPRGGDAIDAYRILNGLSFKAALAAMANEIGF